jgi:Cytochrome c2
MQPLPCGRRRREKQGRAGAQRPRWAQVRHVADYSYSDANKKAEITWSEAAFKDYIQNPMAKVPGTKMAFAGIKNDKEIGDLWAYLKQFKADGSK